VSICSEQLGFQAGSGTRDNVFVLRELIRKFRAKRLYTCFVDFKMAFDSVDRQLLFDKLEKLPGMDLVWLRMLRAMYSGVQACVKGSNTWFSENIGVKQGDPLSPLLFLLYIHDLPDALLPPDGTTDPASTTALAQRIIRCLLYADDLALPSRTEAGLQTLLKRLEDYCRRWKLTVNVPKTKIVVFHSARQPAPLSSYHFTYGGEQVECVSKFKYVGIWFHQSGLMRDTFADILSASRRAMYACMGRVNRLGPIAVSFKVSLFNAYVRPVMLYCAEALPLNCKQLEALDQLQLQYIRWSLGRLPQSSPRTDTLTETGQKPISHDAARFRINYYLLVKSRPNAHITVAALDDAIVAKQQRDNWWSGVQRDRSAMQCDDQWLSSVEHSAEDKNSKERQQFLHDRPGQRVQRRGKKPSKGRLNKHLPTG